MSDNERVLVIAGDDGHGSFRIEDDSLPKKALDRVLGRFANPEKLAGAFGVAMLKVRRLGALARQLSELDLVGHCTCNFASEANCQDCVAAKILTEMRGPECEAMDRREPSG